MTIYPISATFAVHRVPMTWNDILHAYERQYVGWTCPVEMARRRVAEGSASETERELATTEKSNSFRVGDLLRELANLEGSPTPVSSAEKWLYVSLAWIYENKSSLSDPLACVEMVYVDFDYPEEVESFIRYMPPADGFDPSQHSAEECTERLMANWVRYLAQERVWESRELKDQ